MQNDTPITKNRTQSKKEEKFQYGGRLFSHTGSSHGLIYLIEIWYANN